jgi:hypothetical protein
MSANSKRTKPSAIDEAKETNASKQAKISPGEPKTGIEPQVGNSTKHILGQTSQSTYASTLTPMKAYATTSFQPPSPNQGSTVSFQPPSPNRGFGNTVKNKSKNFPTVEIMYDPITLLGFAEVVPLVTKKTQYLGALSFPPNLSEVDVQHLQKKLLEKNFFVKVCKSVGGSLVKEDKVSPKTGKPYTVYQSMFVFWIDNNLDIKSQLELQASRFLDVRYYYTCITLV